MTTSYEARQQAQAAIKSAASSKGLEVFFTANIGYIRGSSRDEVVLVCGNTFAVKDTLKAHGAVWSGREKCWVFAKAEDCTAALAAI